jgi:hypothetical protein
MNTAIKLQVPRNGGEFVCSSATVGFSKIAKFHGVSSVYFV